MRINFTCEIFKELNEKKGLRASGASKKNNNINV